MPKIHVEFQGSFNTREEAVEALRDAIVDVASGKFIASAPNSAPYMIFITQEEDENE